LGSATAAVRFHQKVNTFRPSKPTKQGYWCAFVSIGGFSTASLSLEVKRAV
jgi:hypothetical protein